MKITEKKFKNHNYTDHRFIYNISIMWSWLIHRKYFKILVRHTIPWKIQSAAREAEYSAKICSKDFTVPKGLLLLQLGVGSKIARKKKKRELLQLLNQVQISHSCSYMLMMTSNCFITDPLEYNPFFFKL
jgi:hypothetical protein